MVWLRKRALLAGAAGHVAIVVLMLAALAATPRAARAQASGWRSAGTAVASDAHPVEHWSPRKNLLWSTTTPSWSNATPVVVGDRIYALSEPHTLLAFDTKTGAIVWRREITYLQTLTPEERARAEQQLAEADRAARRLAELLPEERRLKRLARKGEEPEGAYARLREISKELKTLTRRVEAAARHRTPEIPFIGYTSASLASDGANLYLVLGNGVAARYDRDGNAAWTVWVGAPHERPLGFDHGQTASPLVVGDRLIVGVGKLAALDLRTGEVLWRGPEYPHYGSPNRARVGDRDLVVTPRELVDAADGKVLAKLDRPLYYTGPVVDGSRVYFVGGIDEGTMRARAFDIAADGADTTWRAAWDQPLPDDQHFAEPLVHGDLIYTVDEEATLLVLSTADGSTVRRQPLPLQTVFSGLVLANGLLFVTDEAGATLVLSLGEKIEQVARNRVADFVRATPVFVGDRIYLRGIKQLYAIGAAPPADAAPPTEPATEQPRP